MLKTSNSLQYATPVEKNNFVNGSHENRSYSILNTQISAQITGVPGTKSSDKLLVPLAEM